MQNPMEPGKEIPPPVWPPVDDSAPPRPHRPRRIPLPVAAPIHGRPTGTRRTTQLRTPASESVDARALAGQTFLFSEFLHEHAPEFKPPELGRHAILHGHCHQKALFGMHADQELLSRFGIDHQLLDSGCCGMAGSFGYERDKYTISQQIGELVLLPAVRQATIDTLIVTDGFSCREQITQATGRPTLHLAEATRLAIRTRY